MAINIEEIEKCNGLCDDCEMSSKCDAIIFEPETDDRNVSPNNKKKYKEGWDI